MENLTKREKQVLLELIKNARISDQEISKKIGTSRPTVVKVRQRLEKKIIKKYTASIDYESIGLKIIATTFFRWDDFSRKKEMEKVFAYIKKNPAVIRFCSGVGMGSMTMILISVHEDLKKYESFWKDLQEQGGQDIREVQAFLSTTTDMYKKYDHSEIFMHYLLEQSKVK